MNEPIINLEDLQGRVVAVPVSCCYPPREDGMILCTLGGFSYLWGRPTDKPVTHKPNDHPDLFRRGELEPI